MVSLPFTLSPMMVLAVWIEHALEVSVQRTHHADALKHGRPAVAFGDQDQGFYRGLPFLDLLFGLR
jgi:hypothetical protein